MAQRESPGIQYGPDGNDVTLLDKLGSPLFFSTLVSAGEKKRAARISRVLDNPQLTLNSEDNKQKYKMAEPESNSSALYDCSHCVKAFHSRTKLKNHERKCHGESVVCPVCQVKLTSKAYLNQHVANVHHPKINHRCQECQQGFKTLPELNLHHLVHTGEKNHHCSLCPKAFSKSSNLKTHFRSHTGEKPHVCSVCKKAFSIMSNLRIHLKLHSGEKSHRCEICSKAFTQQSHLKKHLRTHTGEKPYSCVICLKAFSDPGHLRSHLKFHTGETFNCSVCMKSFSQKSDVRRHEKTHARD